MQNINIVLHAQAYARLRKQTVRFYGSWSLLGRRWDGRIAVARNCETRNCDDLGNSPHTKPKVRKSSEKGGHSPHMTSACQAYEYLTVPDVKSEFFACEYLTGRLASCATRSIIMRNA